MDAYQIEIARVLANRAFDKQRITYPELARDILHYHPTGRGLGKDLWEILAFTKRRSLPCLTSILVKSGTYSPPEDALAHIRKIYGDVDIPEEQNAVFSFDWSMQITNSGKIR